MRFAEGSFLLQTAHFSTLRPSGFACQHAALRAACQHFSCFSTRREIDYFEKTL
jgi:hypothetical protein